MTVNPVAPSNYFQYEYIVEQSTYIQVVIRCYSDRYLTLDHGVTSTHKPGPREHNNHNLAVVLKGKLRPRMPSYSCWYDEYPVAGSTMADHRLSMMAHVSADRVRRPLPYVPPPLKMLAKACIGCTYTPRIKQCCSPKNKHGSATRSTHNTWQRLLSHLTRHHPLVRGHRQNVFGE